MTEIENPVTVDHMESEVQAEEQVNATDVHDRLLRIEQTQELQTVILGSLATSVNSIGEMLDSFVTEAKQAMAMLQGQNPMSLLLKGFAGKKG
jgi:hypothetical protein